MTMILSDQISIVTGASSGLGRATALALAMSGADIALIARSAVDLAEVAREIEALGRRTLILPLDLNDETAISSAVTRTIQELGPVDILVNAAGTDVPGPVVDLTSTDWDHVLGVNLRAPFLLAKAVFPVMAQAGRGTIVNVSSVAGKRGWANAAAYCASKFGLTGLTQSLAAEGKRHGIRACVLFPGGMDTQWGQWTPEARTHAHRAPVEPTRSLLPGDVATLIVWIAAAPAELVLNEVIVTPIDEQGWP